MPKVENGVGIQIFETIDTLGKLLFIERNSGGG